ncbi:MAG: polyketide synthase dehydratase domain-containing protein [Prochloraceae cyanobacterium]|nr:polyketide synthase dehydratase domain-containing protein [Prochloraceae cyanobacterium]
MNGLGLYKNGTLFHGPCFQGITQILNINREQLTLQCISPIVSEKNRGQFVIQSINPYSADALFQSMLVWVREFENSASLPLEFQK